MTMLAMSVISERTQWASLISAAWQKSVDSIIETGRLLLAAKADPKMQLGEWGTMIESDLPFNRHTAHKLMQIAADKRLTDVSHGKHLPPSWTTLYELTKLDDDTFDQKLRDGTIHPGMQRKDVARKNCIPSREHGLRRVAAGRGDIEDVFNGIEPEYAKPNAVKQAWVTATEPEPLAFVEAAAAVEKQRSLAGAAKTLEQINAVTEFSACDPEASKTSVGIGKEADPAPALDPQAWSMSTAKERQAFVKAVGRSEIEDAFHAIESGYGWTRGLNALNESWKGATESDQREFYRRLFPANVWNRFQT
jgi:hypothetical protein